MSASEAQAKADEELSDVSDLESSTDEAKKTTTTTTAKPKENGPSLLAAAKAPEEPSDKEQQQQAKNGSDKAERKAAAAAAQAAASINLTEEHEQLDFEADGQWKDVKQDGEVEPRKTDKESNDVATVAATPKENDKEVEKSSRERERDRNRGKDRDDHRRGRDKDRRDRDKDRSRDKNREKVCHLIDDEAAISRRCRGLFTHSVEGCASVSFLLRMYRDITQFSC